MTLPKLVRRLTKTALAFALLGAAVAQTPASDPAGQVPRDPLEGVWTGTITAPQGTEADLGLEFIRTPKGALVFKLHFPDMFTYGYTFGIPVVNRGGGDYAIDPHFKIKLRLDGDRLTGTFGEAQMPLALTRGGKFAERPATPSYPAAPPKAWEFDLGAPTWAPPVGHDDIVYVGTSAGMFHAVRGDSGAPVWSWSGPHAIDGRAVIAQGTVFVMDAKTNLLALDLSTGALKWSVSLHDEAIAGKPVPDNPTFNHRAATPLVHEDVVYVGSSDGGLYAVDARNGTKLWRHDAKAPIFSGVGLHNNRLLMFGTMDGSVVALDRETRQETLRAKTGGGVVTTPIVADGIVIVGSRDYLLYGINLDDGSVAWRFSYWFSWIESTPVLQDGLVYVGASDYARVSAIRPATGQAEWSTIVHGMCWGSPLVTEETVFTGTAAQNLPGTVINHEGGIVAIDRATGRIKWRHTVFTPDGKFGGYAGSLGLAAGNVIGAGFDGKLVAFPAR